MPVSGPESIPAQSRTLDADLGIGAALRSLTTGTCVFKETVITRRTEMQGPSNKTADGNTLYCRVNNKRRAEGRVLGA